MIVLFNDEVVGKTDHRGGLLCVSVCVCVCGAETHTPTAKEKLPLLAVYRSQALDIISDTITPSSHTLITC